MEYIWFHFSSHMDLAKLQKSQLFRVKKDTWEAPEEEVYLHWKYFV